VVGFGSVDPGVADVDLDAVLAQPVNDVEDAGVAQVGAVLFEGQSEDQDAVLSGGFR
jgi:hypothetical protein